MHTIRWTSLLLLVAFFMATLFADRHPEPQRAQLADPILGRELQRALHQLYLSPHPSLANTGMVFDIMNHVQ